MEAALPGLALAAVAPYNPGPGLASGVGGHRDRGDREQQPGAQQQVGAECERTLNIVIVKARTQMFSSCCKEKYQDMSVISKK